MSLPDAAPVLDLMDAFRRSKAMFTAVSFGIFDLLHGGEADSATLAARTGTQPEALGRLLDACAALGLLRKRDGLYSNDPAADAYLRRESPHTLTGYILYADEALWQLWARLGDAVREGTHRWDALGSADGLFDHFFATEDRMRLFLGGMHGLGSLSSPAVVAAFDLGRFRRLVDLGGASGHLAIAACEKYPDLQAAIVDLAKVVSLAPALHYRVKYAAGDFFRDPLPEADLFALGRILHDWPATRIELLLRKIVDRLPPGGGLLVAEKLLNADRVGPVPANLQCLNMLVSTEGRERTAEEYSALLREAGFATVEAKRTGAPLDAILAIKN